MAELKEYRKNARQKYEVELPQLREDIRHHLREIAFLERSYFVAIITVGGIWAAAAESEYLYLSCSVFMIVFVAFCAWRYEDLKNHINIIENYILNCDRYFYLENGWHEFYKKRRPRDHLESRKNFWLLAVVFTVLLILLINVPNIKDLLRQELEALKLNSVATSRGATPPCPADRFDLSPRS